MVLWKLNFGLLVEPVNSPFKAQSVILQMGIALLFAVRREVFDGIVARRALTFTFSYVAGLNQRAVFPIDWMSDC